MSQERVRPFEEIYEEVKRQAKTELERAAERNAEALVGHGARLEIEGASFVWVADSGYQRFHLTFITENVVAVGGRLTLQPARHRSGSLPKSATDEIAIERFLRQFGWKSLGWIDVANDREAYEMALLLDGCSALVLLYARHRTREPNQR